MREEAGRKKSHDLMTHLLVPMVELRSISSCAATVGRRRKQIPLEQIRGGEGKSQKKGNSAAYAGGRCSFP